MTLLKGLLGMAAIVLIFLAAFYAYSNLSRKSSTVEPSQTATVNDSIGEKVAVSPSTTATSRPNLDGFNDNQLKEGLDKIKASLDLLQDPIE